MDEHVIRPEIDQDSAPYWASVKEHKAKIQKCNSCGKYRFPPSPSCYYCGSPDGSWESIAGKGALYSWIVVHHPVDKRFASEVPFVVALVELAEGPRIVGRMYECRPEDMKAGMPVQVQYRNVDSELTLINFKPAT